MNWIRNDISEDDINKIINNIDMDLLNARLNYNLHINDIHKYIEDDYIKSLIANILYNRNIVNVNDINNLFNQLDNNLVNPYDFKNAKLGAELINSFINKNIVIYGDYDCDGILSTYILKSVIKDINNNVNLITHIPERSEGYGLSLDYCNYIINTLTAKDTLIITVDNGITKVEEIQLLKDNGFECLIIDHHISQENIPNCLIVDAHNQINAQEEYQHLCGCGAVFKVCEILQDLNNNKNMLKYLPWLTIATIADVMPFNNENMTYIQYGLDIINSKNCPIGIKELMKKKNIDIMTVEDIAWTIAPILNACGRMGNVNNALYLTDTDTKNINKKIAWLISNNDTRIDVTKKAVKRISKLDFSNNKVCIVIDNNIPVGILGIIAGKVQELFNKPAIVCNEYNGICHGSVRSDNIDMFTILQQLKANNIIIDCGGHAEACACSFDIKNLDIINKSFNDIIIYKDIEDNNQEQDILVDHDINLCDLNKYTKAIINILPCDNKEYQYPVLQLNNIKVIGYSCSKNNPDNICLTVKDDSIKKTMDIWAWGFSPIYKDILNCPDNINMIGSITKDFKNRYTLKVIDIKAA